MDKIYNYKLNGLNFFVVKRGVDYTFWNVYLNEIDENGYVETFNKKSEAVYFIKHLYNKN